jgi:hypothetical protein
MDYVKHLDALRIGIFGEWNHGSVTRPVPDSDAELLRASFSAASECPPSRYRPLMGTGLKEQCPSGIVPRSSEEE